MSPDDHASESADPAAPTPSGGREGVWQGWQRALAETGGPNTLLWQAGTASDGAGQAALLDLTTAHPSGLSMLLAGRPTRLSDLVREPSAFASALTLARAVRLHADELSRERGLSTCFLGAGVATWEQRGQSPRAPVLLRACSLRPIDLTASDFAIDASPSVELNPALAQLLRSHAVSVDAVQIAGLATAASGFDPYPVYGVVGRLGEGLPGFAVTPRLVVGTFPHSKLAMVSDVGSLSRSGTGDGSPTPSSGITTVASELATWLSEPAAVAVPDIAPLADADPDPDPAREPLVLDADADQAHIVQTVLRGQSVLVDAPPQTGTTQTIAALLAALAASGRTVLLVSQRRRDLLEAADRLGGVGLGDIVVHADHGAVSRLADLVSRTRAAGAQPNAEKARSTASLDRLRDQRGALRDHVESLHRRRAPWQVSAFEAQRAVLDLQSNDPRPTSAVRIDSAPLSRLTRERVAELAGQLEAAVEAGAWVPGQGEDPWFGARVETEQDVVRAELVVGRLTSGPFDVAARTLDSVLAESSLPPATSVSDWSRAVETMSGVSETLEVFRPEVFDLPLDEHVAATAGRGQRDAGDPEVGWLAGSRVRRHARSLLRPGRPPADLHGELVRAREQRSAWQALVGAGGRPEISPRLDEAQEALAGLDDDLVWLESVLQGTAAGGDLRSAPFEDLHVRLAALAQRRDRLRVLPQVVPVVDALREAGMGKVVADFAARGVPAEQVRTELSHIWWGSITREVAASDSGYGRFDGAGLHASEAGFVAADEAHLAASAARVGETVAARRLEALRTGAAGAGRLASIAEGPDALGSLWQTSPELLLGLAPCWAASPYAVAETFPSSVRFDVVVVDGASQLATAAAVSALARASVVAAFGDEKQAPPTGFVVGELGAGSGSDGSLYSDLCGRLPSWRLRWAHGVTDERVVAFANEAVYGGELVTVPGPALSPAVTLRVVDGRARVDAGSGSGGGAGAAIESTDAEVAEVVTLVLDHARTRAGESLAVVALNAVHARRIQEALASARTALRGEDAVLEALSNGGADAADRPAEPFVVVDGAHGAVGGYDAVILTVGYGKTTHGGVLHRFPELAGPLASRRLTSALTVARRRLTVVSSVSGSDLDPARLEPAGLMLRGLLLQLAGEGSDVPSPETATRSGDPLMADLARRLRREGLVVDEAVGIGTRRVELAVRDPREEATGGRYVVGIEGDGESYASLVGSRTRDRLWPQALDRRGWRTVRVWSTDLFRDPAREVSRIVGLVREATGGAVSGAAPTPAAFDSGANRESGSDADLVPGDASGSPAAGGAAKDGKEGMDGKDKRGKGLRKRRRAEQTKDDTDLGWGERPDSDSHDQWLQEQRPPHWE